MQITLLSQSRRFSSLCVAASLLLAVSLSAARGQQLANKPNDTWVTNGYVKAIKLVGDKVYIGGRFDRIGPRSGPGVDLTLDGSLNPKNLEIAGAGPGVSLHGAGVTVAVVISDGVGGWFIGGLFTRVGGVPCTNLAHILSNNTVDQNFRPYVNDHVLTLSLSGSTLYVGGSFTKVNGNDRRRLAAFNLKSVNAAGGHLLPFNPGCDGADVNSIALSADGSTLYIGGLYNTVGGKARNNFAAVKTSDGTVTPLNPNTDGGGVVYSVAASGSTIYIGGFFETMGGQSRHNIAAVNASSGKATAFAPNADSGVGVLLVGPAGETVYAGGIFKNIGGAARNGLAALRSGDGVATAFDPHGNSNVTVLALSGSILYVGGGFASYDGLASIGGQPRNFAAALNRFTGEANSFNPNPNFTPRSIAVSPNGVYMAGSFTSLGGVVRYSLAALRASDGVPTDFDPHLTTDNDPFGATVNALEVFESTIYLGGNFNHVGNEYRSNIAAVNAATGLATGWSPLADSEVSALAISGKNIYAGGYFSFIGGQARNGVAAVRLADGTATDFDARSNQVINAIVAADPVIYVGGLFTFIGGQPRNKLAALDVSTGNAVSYFNPDLTQTGNCLSLALSEKTLFVGGVFPTVHGVPRLNLAAVHAADGLPTSFDPHPEDTFDVFGNGGYVFALEVSGATVYAGGTFDKIGGQRRGLVAGLDAATGKATNFNAQGQPGGIVYSLAVGLDRSLHVGGEFDTFALAPQQGIAAFSPLPPASPAGQQAPENATSLEISDAP